jgi:hypothetical protein
MNRFFAFVGIAAIVLSGLAGAGEFKLKKSKVSIEDVLAAVGSHFNRKTVCANDPAANPAKQTFDANLSSDSYWHAVCQISEQSGIGFSVDRTGTVFSRYEYPVVKWLKIRKGALAFFGPILFKQEDGKPFPEVGMELVFMRDDKNFGNAELEDLKVLAGTAPLRARRDGFSRLESRQTWSYMLPVESRSKPLSISAKMKVTANLSPVEMVLEAKDGAVKQVNDVSVKITSVRSDSMTIFMYYTGEWDSGLSKAEVERLDSLDKNRNSKGELSADDERWVKEITKRGIRQLSVAEVLLQNSAGKTKSVMTKLFGRFGGSGGWGMPGKGLQGYVRFPNVVPLAVAKFVFLLAEKRPEEHEVKFEGIDFGE